ncbi:hypothetical protein FCV25MIE_19444, partial [Fagus crenata]
MMVELTSTAGMYRNTTDEQSENQKPLEQRIHKRIKDHKAHQGWRLDPLRDEDQTHGGLDIGPTEGGQNPWRGGENPHRVKIGPTRAENRPTRGEEQTHEGRRKPTR